jgi:SpoIID/LytB domain protein
MSKVKLIWGTLFVLCLSVTMLNVHKIKSDEIDDLESQLNQTREQLNQAQSSRSNTETELQRLEKLKKNYQGALGQLQNNYQLTRSQLDVIQRSITEREGELEANTNQIKLIEEDLVKRTDYLKANARSLYISDSPSINWVLGSLFNSEDTQILAHVIFYQNMVLNSAQTKIKELNQEVHKVNEIKVVLEEIKNKLAADKDNLIAQQRQLQSQIGNTQSQLNNAVGQQTNLQQALAGLDEQINSLSQKQKDILAAKAAAALATTSVGNTEINKSAIDKNPPQDGQVYFSFWTYGYPHRVGMSQYGAFGRAIAGQNVEQILKAYYQGVEVVNWSVLDQITISENSGNRTIAFEDDYLLGIGEMPSCWGSPDRKGMEALKAQAIAARTYALNYTNNGAGAICTDQRCQVYVGSSKTSGTCGEYWKQAVEETRGRVITTGGQLISAWYASTSGGFTVNSEDTSVFGSYRSYARGITDADSSGKPYEGPEYGNSPWYHKSWGNEPWLSIEQVTDLLNAAKLPESYNNSLALESKGGFSSNEVINKLVAENIEPITDLRALEIIDQNGRPGANTAHNKSIRVYYQDNKMVEISSERFKFVYNLRSPGTNAIWSTRYDILTAAEL